MLTRACTWWSFPEVDARLRETLRDEVIVKMTVQDAVEHAKSAAQKREDGRLLRSGCTRHMGRRPFS
jgi:hypothetical protein